MVSIPGSQGEVGDDVLTRSLTLKVRQALSPKANLFRRHCPEYSLIDPGALRETTEQVLELLRIRNCMFNSLLSFIGG